MIPIIQSERDRQIDLTKKTIRTLRSERDRANALFQNTGIPKYQTIRDDAARQIAHQVDTLDHLVKVES